MTTNLQNQQGIRRASRCVSVEHDAIHGTVQPISTSTAYYYLDQGPQPYPRYFNTSNQALVARTIADLEGADAGLVFGSGMAAISTCVMALVSPGDHVLLLDGLYGGTHSFFVSELKKWGVAFDFISTDVADFEQKRRDNTKFAYVESPTNPCLDVLDLRAFCSAASDAGVVSIIDNTFATPINQHPIELGFDLVVHSGTKYLGGHSDLTSGAVVGRSDLLDCVRSQATKYGGILSPLDCYLLERSIKTLDVRVRRQNENALAIAEFLETQDSVTTVRYPGLPSHNQHELAASQMDAFGGMVAFELRPGRSVRDFLTRLEIITPALSLGGVESTVCVPALTSHKEMSPEERLACGVTDRLLRFSTGIEASSDLISDLSQSLAAP